MTDDSASTGRSMAMAPGTCARVGREVMSAGLPRIIEVVRYAPLSNLESFEELSPMPSHTVLTFVVRATKGGFDVERLEGATEEEHARARRTLAKMVWEAALFPP